MLGGLIQNDILGGVDHSPLGRHYLQICDADRSVPALDMAPSNGLIRLLVDRHGELPNFDIRAFDLALTIAPNAPSPWVSIDARRFDAHVTRLVHHVGTNPVAACTMARVLRLTEDMAFDASLEVESMAYSMLLAGEEFRNWRKQRDDRSVGHTQAVGTGQALVRYDRMDDRVTLTLQSPQNHNAMTAAMRDALFEGVANVLDDPSKPSLYLQAEGKSFSTGGHLPEFGTADDVARAHYVRSFRSAALLIHRLGERAEVLLNGACIGSGIELGAAASRRYAAPNMFAQLPEVGMGLIPGAGGCVTIARAVGRHRCLWMALSGARVKAATALAWGLVHQIVQP